MKGDPRIKLDVRKLFGWQAVADNACSPAIGAVKLSSVKTGHIKV